MDACCAAIHLRCPPSNVIRRRKGVTEHGWKAIAPRPSLQLEHRRASTFDGPLNHRANIFDASPAQAMQPQAGATPFTHETAAAQSLEEEVQSLRARFGSENVKFEAAAGIRTAELSVSDGSKCRVLIDGARITSYEAAQWHGGQEQVLYTQEADDLLDNGDVTLDDAGWDIVEGGLVLNFPAFGGLQIGQRRVLQAMRAANATWTVEHASTASQDSSVTSAELRLSCEGSHTISDDFTGFWKIVYTVTLSKAGLAAAAKITNVGLRPFHMAPSLMVHMSVADVDGCFLIGCKGHEYLSNEVTPQRVPASFGEALSGWWRGLRGSSSEASRGSEVSASKGRSERQQPASSTGQLASYSQPSFSGPHSSSAHPTSGGPDLQGAGSDSDLIWQSLSNSAGGQGGVDTATGGGLQDGSKLRRGIERNEYASLQEGICRLFPSQLQSVTLVDRGARRSFMLTSEELPDFLVHNPGSQSRVEGWPKFVSLGFGLATKTRSLMPGQSWTGSLFLGNLGGPDS